LTIQWFLPLLHCCILHNIVTLTMSLRRGQNPASGDMMDFYRTSYLESYSTTVPPSSRNPLVKGKNQTSGFAHNQKSVSSVFDAVKSANGEVRLHEVISSFSHVTSLRYYLCSSPTATYLYCPCSSALPRLTCASSSPSRCAPHIRLRDLHSPPTASHRFHPWNASFRS